MLFLLSHNAFIDVTAYDLYSIMHACRVYFIAFTFDG